MGAQYADPVPDRGSRMGRIHEEASKIAERNVLIIVETERIRGFARMPVVGPHEGMRCPKCGIGRMRSVRRYAEDELFWIRRKRICRLCQHEQTTTEMLDGPLPERVDPSIFSDTAIDRTNQSKSSSDIDGQRYLFEK